MIPTCCRFRCLVDSEKRRRRRRGGHHVCRLRRKQRVPMLGLDEEQLNAGSSESDSESESDGDME